MSRGASVACVTGFAGAVTATTSRATAAEGGRCPDRSGAKLARTGCAGGCACMTFALASCAGATRTVDRATGCADTNACCGTTVTALGLFRLTKLTFPMRVEL